MRYVILMMSLFSASCFNDAVLHRVCNQPCVVDSNGNVLLDDEAVAYTCKPGTLKCDDADQYYCFGYEDPQSEYCIIKQGDCSETFLNGETVPHYSMQNPCTGQGVCAQSSARCVDGKIVCIPPPYYGPEICDGSFRDEDCDGLVDAEDDSLLLSGEEWQYPGDSSTMNRGLCRAGHLECINGNEELVGLVLPVSEVCQDNIDNDCDGLTDEVIQQPVRTAFILILDFSGSMSSYIDVVANAICDWSAGQRFQQSKFALLAVSGSSALNAPYLEQISDFSDAHDTCTSLVSYLASNNYGVGNEFVPYAIWSVHNTNIGQYTWPTDLSKEIIFFTDEEPQGYIDINTDEIAYVEEDCIDNNYKLSGFIKDRRYMWQSMTTTCGGVLEDLTLDAVILRSRLEMMFGGSC